MRGTPSLRTTWACLPMARRICEQASTEPMASPSGRACEVSTKRSRCSMCFSTSVSTLGFLPFSLLRPIQQFRNASLILLRAIHLKKQFWRTPQAEVVGQFVPDKASGGSQTLQRAVGFGIVALDNDKDTSRTGIGSELHLAHIDQSDAGISQFALENGLNLLAKSFAQTFAMVLLAALYGHSTFRIKRMRISENRPLVGVPEGRELLDRHRPDEFGNRKFGYRNSTKESVTSAPLLLAIRIAWRSTFFMR